MCCEFRRQFIRLGSSSFSDGLEAQKSGELMLPDRVKFHRRQSEENLS